MHHSQLEINFFTEQRIHPMDWIFVRLVRFVPMMMIAQSVTIVAIVEWSLLQYSRVYHANIRTNLGILRYVLVTPQSHRIHHSPYPQHQDKNFGVVFSIWDYLFGTQYHGYDEYPDTGIADTGFPREQSFGWPSTLFTLLRQYAYPFRRVARRWSTDS